MIIDRYIPIWGGAENQLRQLIPHLIKSDCKVKIITRRWKEELSPQDYVDNIPVVRVGFPGRGIISTLSYLAGLLGYVICQRKTIDLIHTHGAAALGATGCLLGKLINKPNLGKVSSPGRIPKLHKHLLGRVVLWIFIRSNKIVCLTEEIYGELKAINTPEDRISHIPNGVDINRFHPSNAESKSILRANKNLPQDIPIVLFAGRLDDPRKGADILIKSWPIILSSYPNSKLIVVGSVKNQPQLLDDFIKTEFNNKELTNVKFVGETNCPEEYYGLADILVLPSREEGFSNVLIEAMASGLIVICSKTGGVNDIVNADKSGILFHPENIDDLASKVVDTLKNMNKRKVIGLNARENIIEKYRFELIADQYLKIYEQLTK